jgi:hypothetical protein
MGRLHNFDIRLWLLVFCGIQLNDDTGLTTVNHKTLNTTS